MFNKLTLYFIFMLFIYSAIFTVYFFLIVCATTFKNRNAKLSDIRREYKNLIVVIYSHNNEKTIVNLLEQLNKQDYPKGNYQIHIILDNCSDNSSNKLEFVGGAKLWRLTDDTPWGKDKAVSWLLENLMSFKKVDAYVFLNANRIVNTDFLANINEALQENDVVVGSTEIFLEAAAYHEKVWANVNEYNMGIMRNGRAKLGLAVPIDSDITVIKHSVLEKVQCIDFKDANSELKYSFLLTRVGYPPKFVPSVKTYVSSSDYEVRRPDFLFKVSLFCHCFSLRAASNIKFFEFLFSLFKPNPILLIACIAIIITYSLNYSFLDNFPWAIFFAVILAVSFAVSLYRTNLFYFKQLIYLISCPFYTLADTLCEMTFIKKLFKSRKYNNENLKTERISVPVNVTNGRSIFNCTLELISEGGFKKAIFKYKNKKQETVQSYVRMCDAVKNISEQHGFRLKICQSCAYFSPKIDGTNNMVKGYCNKKAAENRDAAQAPETLLWSSCESFLPQEVNNVIDISKFMKK